jgi:hypothetical protein
MYGNPREEYLNELEEEYREAHPDKYVVKDSGKKFESPDGMVRDTSEGKPQFTLMFPKGVPYEEQLMTRVADLYYKGGVKYGPRNWEKSSTEESLAKHEDCLMRHVVKFLLGMEDEDHAAAVVWNVNAVLLTRRNLAKNKAYSNDTVKLSTKGVKEVLPEYAPNQDLIGHVTEAPKDKHDKACSRSDRCAGDKCKPSLAVEFRAGDYLLDENNDRWVFDGHRWRWENAVWTTYDWPTLVNWYAPLYIQTGDYAGMTVLKDGSTRWE